MLREECGAPLPAKQAEDRLPIRERTEKGSYQLLIAIDEVIEAHLLASLEGEDALGRAQEPARAPEIRDDGAEERGASAVTREMLEKTAQIVRAQGPHGLAR